MSTTQPGEFALIKQYFSGGFPANPNTRTGVGDDCSVISLPTGYELAQSIDTQVENIHFPANAPAYLIAQRALRCAVSDLAAMGAEVQGFHLALTLAKSDSHWLADFSNGLKDAASEFNIELLGGDTTSGSALVITIAVQGFVPAGKALLRSGANIGDDIWVSGSIGASALALPLVLKNPAENSALTLPYYFPQPQLNLAIKLRELATACMDISDGLIQDAGHIAARSQVTLDIQAESVPLPTVAGEKDLITCLTGGDDYQLLFTAPESVREKIDLLRKEFSQLSCIGKVTSQLNEQPVRLFKASEELQLTEHTGYRHF